MKDEIKEILDNPKILMLSYGNYISLDDYVKLKDYITKDTYNEICAEQVDYKSRNEKAIEYIKSFGNDSDRKNYSLYYNEIINKVLNILQGSDKE